MAIEFRSKANACYAVSISDLQPEVLSSVKFQLDNDRQQDELS